MVTLDRLKEVLFYDPKTGQFIWLVDRGSNKVVGTVAGWDRGDGYLTITIDNKNYRAHRLAWFYMTGEWPKGLIDHKDVKKKNNSFANLREASCSQNKANGLAYANNTSGVKGVFFCANRKRQWRAMIRKDGHLNHIGSFYTKEEAQLAYQQAAIKHFGEFSRTEGGQ